MKISVFDFTIDHTLDLEKPTFVEVDVLSKLDFNITVKTRKSSLVFESYRQRNSFLSNLTCYLIIQFFLLTYWHGFNTLVISRTSLCYFGMTCVT